MNFPVIEHIDDILPHIKDYPNFYVKDREDYIYVDYILNTPDMFNNPYQKECRGLIFYKNGNIMARRLHKFFNLNERPESKIENINLQTGNWKILEKLDGSLITPVFSKNRLTWGSMAGITFLTPQVEEFVKAREHYRSFANHLFGEYTPIFEWCSNQNRIVIPHPNDRLVLTAIRNTVYGDYMPYDSMKSLAELFDIECVEQFPFKAEATINDLADLTKKLKGTEGFVIRSSHGQMVKIKAEEYCLFHSTKENIGFEKNVVNIIVDKKTDDIKPLMMKEDAERLELFENKFLSNLLETTREINNLIYKYNYKTIDRRTFALNILPSLKPHYKKFIFEYFDKEYPSFEQVWENVKLFIKNNTNSQERVDKVRSLWDDKGSLKWT